MPNTPKCCKKCRKGVKGRLKYLCTNTLCECHIQPCTAVPIREELSSCCNAKIESHRLGDICEECGMYCTPVSAEEESKHQIWKDRIPPRCKSSPLCSHNTNGRDFSLPCSIALNPPSPKQEEGWEEIDELYKKIDEYYRQNFDESQPRKKMYITELISYYFAHRKQKLLKEVGKKRVEVQYDNPILETECVSYNQALTDIIKLINDVL